jgi:MFS family permease
MLLTGWLLDRYPPRFVLVAGQVLLALAMVMLLLADSPALALTYSALRGASGGLWMVSADVVWPSYFGRRHLGSIRGITFAVGSAGAAIGPIPFGLAYDALGGYNAAIAGLLVLPIAAAVAVARVGPPAPRTEAVAVVGIAR